MIRSYTLTKRPPVSRLVALAGPITSQWSQTVDLPDDVRKYFLSQVPHFKTLCPPSVVMHTTWDSIDKHRDCLATSVFLFPLKFGKTTKLFVEDHEVSFSRGKMYRFNDHHCHGVANPNHANLILVTVSYD